MSWQTARACACLLLFYSSFSWPIGSATAEQLLDDLAAHVGFLSQPKLQGRKTRTTGARLARQYVEKEFKNCGLLPWSKAKSYELPFGLGVNVVGVVPGADTNLAHEIVLLSAHYDHLGKDRKGRICPGATDNASGVAVLLEAVRRFSSPQHRPKRTLAFVAFDAEEQMLLGSFAFCCRTDVVSAEIVAVLNVDMLGRDFFDVISNTVFVAGTEGYPDVQSQVGQLGALANIRVLPLGSDLIGPRSDHVAFESRNVPCLFFSCGPFKDYHEPGDTAAKVNFVTLERSARVILQTAEALANADSASHPAKTDCNLQELKSVQCIVSELCRDPGRAGIKDKDISALATLNTRLKMLVDTGTYNPRIRAELILDVARSLGRYFLPLSDEGPAKTGDMTWSTVLPYLEFIYVNFHRELLEGQRRLVDQVLKHPPGLFHGIPQFNYEIYEIQPHEISVVPTGANRLGLHALGNSFMLTARGRPLIWPFGAFQISFSGTFEALDCEGTPEQLIDYCLLYAHADQTNQLRVAAMDKVLTRVTGREPSGDYKDWLKARLEEGGYESEMDWVLACLSSGNPSMAHEALNAGQNSKDVRFQNAVVETMLNRRLRPDVRAHALQLAMNHPDKTKLLGFTKLLNDDTIIFQREHCPQFQPEYPLAECMTFKALQPFLDNTYSQPAKTIGETALENLKKATKRNFGADEQKWKSLLEKWR